MKRILAISAALALSATSVMACPYKSKVQASTPAERPQSTASTEAPAPQQSRPVQVVQDATAASKTASVAE